MPKIRVHRLYCLFGGDFSQQEPKLTADLSNDEKFIAECAAGKDAYGTVASLAFNKPYEECLEFYLDENGKKTDRINKEGKERRTQSKSILLGWNKYSWTLNKGPNIKRFILKKCVNLITQGCSIELTVKPKSKDMAIPCQVY